MSDIELVIKIPEETYKDIQSKDWKNEGKWYSEEWKAIHNGTPLEDYCESCIYKPTESEDE